MDKAEKLMADFQGINYVFDPSMPDGQKGLYIDNHVYLNPRQTSEELTDTVAEEIAHYLTSSGDIISQDTKEKRKQEQKARDLGSTLIVTPQDIIHCYKERFTNVWECADYLGITKHSFEHAVKVYAKMYEDGLSYKNYRIIFRADGTIGVYDFFE
ncbi:MULTISPECIES: ImmA/IrrE family metallo-endopeptidase [Enterococcus]|uniref:IrrE N-terminal-like domain-containing protein n=1 Tax=Enterococcus malodoratus ATCC 43197 TaxID=1158601 RepID=R2NXN7_9ENTE|nr:MULTISPECIES: ImmA/IrrE family metallo-endopeptidase [Enterococcus]EOH75808.1 hypothetical protein UAI_02818 [Enterococcus malodoratus ATCC 43197]EOT66477.1 hypothetical protein I585_01998 [Enterococcus malodoratus ATCC 43197]OJG64665.1 hypothetical protein RV07_GL004041 [Enterococcus malodoratus]SET58013.1 protein of unknown function [Enterococcus malodoratus]SPW90458.1 phage gp35 protein, putative [Enterococcus malodoratus]